MSKKTLQGKVIRDKNNKTIVVLVKRKYAHPFFKKVITLYFKKELDFDPTFHYLLHILWQE